MKAKAKQVTAAKLAELETSARGGGGGDSGGGGGGSAAARWWDAYLADIRKVKDVYHTDWTRRPGAQPLLDADPAMKVQLIAEGLRRFESAFEEFESASSYKSPRQVIGTLALIGALLRADVPIDQPTLAALIEAARERTPLVTPPYAGIIRAAERYATRQPLASGLRDALKRLQQRLAQRKTNESRQHAQRIAALLRSPSAMDFAQPKAPIPSIEPTAQEERLWAEFLAEAKQRDGIWGDAFLKLKSAAPILDADAPTRARLVIGGIRRMRNPRLANLVQPLVTVLLRPALPFDERGIELLLDAAAGAGSRYAPLPMGAVLRAVERFAAKQPLSPGQRQHLQALRREYERRGTSEARKHVVRIDTLLRDASPDAMPDAPPDASPSATPAPAPHAAPAPAPHAAPAPAPHAAPAPSGGAVDTAAAARGGVDPDLGEPWAEQARADLKKMPVAQRGTWQRLLNHAVTARSTQPAQKWLATAGQLIEAIGREAFLERIAAWFALVGKPGVERKVVGWGSATDATQISDANADILKGLAWSAASIDDPRAAVPLGDLAERCFQKVRYLGARQPRVANACLVALARMSGPEAVAQITRVQARAKKPSAKKLVERAMSNAAAQHGMTPEELEELGVPDFGLDLHGQRAFTVGAWAAELRVTGARDAELRWAKAGAAKPQASVPADVKRDHPDALKELKRIVKEIERVLPAQAARIERLLLDGRAWPIDAWRKRYLDHPLVSRIARRLIWQTGGTSPATFVYHDGKFVDAQDRGVKLSPDAIIRLWHPITSPADEVLAWRRWLEGHAAAQPFKQAHREIYLLTDAERRMRTYSNRFAGHILRQHQFHALCGTRGWTYHLMGAWDSANTPTRRLPSYNLRVEYFVDAAPVPDAAPTSGTGVFMHVATDQVRFCRGEAGDAIPLEQVPPVVFSELMRDVDLFVGVSSVGNDPTWHDRGDAYGDAWQRYAFGELTESAETRRDLLSRLIPRLRIAPRCRLEGKFLIVHGELRTYKIHLGSGNILMEPNEQYLCIVPGGRSPADDVGRGVFLPFDGDHTLSVILSKAFLLADDAKIKDPSITGQIRMK